MARPRCKGAIMNKFPVDILDVEQAAKAMLERGMDGMYICTLDELHDFTIHVLALTERRKEKEKALVKN